MKKRNIYKILLLALVVILIANTGFIVLNESTADHEKATAIGSNANGTVYKITTGNLDSNETAVLILGVHPREHEIHEAVNETIKNITNNDGSKLSKKFVIYYVVVNDNITSREETRSAGECLAHQVIVPNIKSENPFVVVDIHEIDGYYEYSNFICPISNNSITNNYADKISKDINVVRFNFTEGTSPEVVTKPISEKGINTLIFETAITNSIHDKEAIAKKLIYSIDSLKP
ncbi:MAG: hypothetical protein Q4P18_06740 [Methanobrevibacter sp.]|uniref:hypothetical protein n=1 Tax=Methanobrevibacter sp. TaxID=66852 RepID=UPI0026DFC283|nr:hypothetical protein [Methanobrevibacter sp.]MDO5849213.1 hypothetical protein [Methanobrevibacter sp.]